MRERLCSAWTVTLALPDADDPGEGPAPGRRASLAAERLEASARRVLEDFQRLLIADGTLAGFAYFHERRAHRLLLHPSDGATGIHYSLLPMIHAIINDLLTPERRRAHVGIIKQHLLAVDGARLFDRPLAYHGGPQSYFQRAESSTFFGREIGIMYTHAHLRYAEAMARYGDADAFFLALRQANPIGLAAVVPIGAARARRTVTIRARMRRSPDRYEALARVRQGKTGEVRRGRRLARLFERRGHRAATHQRVPARHPQAEIVAGARSGDSQALDGLRADVELAGKRVTLSTRCRARAMARPRSAQRHGAALRSRGESVPTRRRGSVDGEGARASHRLCERPRGPASVTPHGSVAALALLLASIVAGGARGEESPVATVTVSASLADSYLAERLVEGVMQFRGTSTC